MQGSDNNKKQTCKIDNSKKSMVSEKVNKSNILIRIVKKKPIQKMSK